MRYFFILLSFLFIVGCSQKEIEPETVPKKKIAKGIQDLLNVPQNIEYYTKNVNFTRASYINTNKYEKSYFSPWNIDEPVVTRDDVQWAFKSYRVGRTYGDNLRPLKQEFFDEMLYQSNIQNYLTLSKRAITLKHVNIRAYPTSKPLLLDPSLAGEGFPFDYLQNSTIQANKPIFATHYSKDGEWVHILSSFTHGWIKSNDIVFLNKDHTDAWQKAQQVFITKENESIYSQSGDFLFKTKIGTMLALVSENEEEYEVLVVSSQNGTKPLFLKAKLSKDIAKKDGLALNGTNFENIANQMLNSNYGWGGIYGERDCSSMLRDLYAPFGLWLPRNSSKQSKIGEVISFDGLDNNQKIALIKEKALPFKTLLYKKGHIMLYVGTYKDEVIIFHDTWGVKTKEGKVEGRIIIGKTIFSTLKLGKEQKNYDKSSQLLRNLKSMNILNF